MAGSARRRYGVDRVSAGNPSDIPWATLIVNATGCLLIGVLMVVLLELTAQYRLHRPFLGIGVVGGFTTFSAYAVEVQVLLADGRAVAALAYLVPCTPRSCTVRTRQAWRRQRVPWHRGLRRVEP